MSENKRTRPASKKSFKGTGADLFLSDDNSKMDTQDTSDIKDVRNTLDTEDIKDVLDTQATKSKKKEYYRLNLKLDMELKEHITDAAWRERISVTEYINNLIRADRDKQGD